MASWIRWKECWAKSCIAAAAMTTPIILSPRGPERNPGGFRVKNKKVYYTEIFEYDYATVALYYETENKSSTDTDLKYIEIYLPGEKTARAKFTAKRTSRGYSGAIYTKLNDLTKAN